MTLAHFAKLAVVALFILGAHHSITHNGKLEKQAEFFITPILSTALYFALLHAGGFFSAFQAPQVLIIAMAFFGLCVLSYRIAAKSLVKVNAVSRLFGALVNHGILYWGGFYNF